MKDLPKCIFCPKPGLKVDRTGRVFCVDCKSKLELGYEPISTREMEDTLSCRAHSNGYPKGFRACIRGYTYCGCEFCQGHNRKCTHVELMNCYRNQMVIKNIKK